MNQLKDISCICVFITHRILDEGKKKTMNRTKQNVLLHEIREAMSD